MLFTIGYEKSEFPALARTLLDAATFFRLYEAQLDTEEAQQVLERLRHLAANESPCVMCYERDPKQCHRMLIAERLASMAGVEVEHLFVGS